MTTPKGISPHQLMNRIGRPDAPVLLDVCVDEDFALNHALIPGSVRVGHRDVHERFDPALEREAVVICHKGLKLSQGAAALLRSEGVKATHLAGGVLAWSAAGLPQIAADQPIPTRWVLGCDRGIDNFLAGWCIHRLVAPHARLLWVAADTVAAVAERFDAAIGAYNEGPLASILPAWSRLDHLKAAAHDPGVTLAFSGTALLSPNPESRFRAVTSLFDMLFAATAIGEDLAA